MSAWVAGAIVVGSVVGAVSSADASRSAGHALERSTNAQVDENRRQYDQTRQDFAPWREAGGSAIEQLARINAGDFSEFFTSPGYEFRRDEGMRDTENRFSVGGGGGNAMRGLVDYNQGTASNEFGNFYNRRLATAGLGMGATAGTAQAGAQSAGNITGAYARQGIGESRNAWNYNAGINNAMTSGLSNWLYADQSGLFDRPSGNRPYQGIPT